LIRVWRICPAWHAGEPLSCEGARLYGGRWNAKGTRLVYCAESLSLACLENLVHVDIRHLPGDLRSIAFDIPDEVSRKVLGAGDLPAGWDAVPGPETLKILGSGWAAARAEAILVVPSAVIRDEVNILINPEHPEVGRIGICPPMPFNFDVRPGLG
jgi:RES domain-containing protein